MSTNAPNILLIMADQLAPQFLPCYGHPLVQAPSLQRLAEEGVVFDAAYTNSPLCAPARFVMMSGRLPSKIGAWDNAAEFPAEIPTFCQIFDFKSPQLLEPARRGMVGAAGRKQIVTTVDSHLTRLVELSETIQKSSKVVELHVTH